MLYSCVSCFVVCRCAVSRRYIDVCYCDMFSVVNVYLDHLKFCVEYQNIFQYFPPYYKCTNERLSCLNVFISHHTKHIV